MSDATEQRSSIQWTDIDKITIGSPVSKEVSEFVHLFPAKFANWVKLTAKKDRNDKSQ